MGSRGRTGGERREGSRVAESLWGAIGLEQMASRGSVTVGSLIDSGYTREELNPPQDAGSARENSTDSEG